MEDLAVLSGRSPVPSSSSASCVFPRHRRRMLLHLVLQPSSSSPFPCRGRCRLTGNRGVRAMAAADGGRPEGLSWEGIFRPLRCGSERFLSGFGERLRKETGLDLGAASAEVGRMVDGVTDVAEKGREAVDHIRLEVVPRFVDWNKWERWKDVKKWEPKRIGALILYIAVVMFSCQRIYVGIVAPRLDRQSRKELTDAYMEALIPEPSPANVRKFKKSIWRKTMPKGLKIKKFVKGPDGSLVQDDSYVGEDAWNDDSLSSEDNVRRIIDNDTRLDAEQKEKLKANLGVTGHMGGSTWRERLGAWKEILRTDKLAEQADSLNAKYVVDFDMEEVEKSLHNEVVEKVSDTNGSRALWISKRWWRYRPKLPYTYFLSKLDCSGVHNSPTTINEEEWTGFFIRSANSSSLGIPVEGTLGEPRTPTIVHVAAVVFSEDWKKAYVTMKDGFPLEYIVDIPLDPYLFEIISSSGVEVDLLQKKNVHYLLKVVVALAPGIIILWFIREAVMLLHITSHRFLYKKYNQLFDMAYADNFILPIGSVDETQSMHKEVILGGDVWDLLDELMSYMKNPMQYYEKEVAFVRGVLLSGPPGTGKTLFARTLAKESGMPFVFASGAEFTDSEKSGAARINEIFSIARRNAPSFVFVDEVDAIAGRHARKDPRRRATFEALLSQLDGQKEKVGVDRFSLRQAVIFICATNRPDELDLEFVRPGRIDRRLYIGLPDAKQRIRIFGVHSSGKKLADDVDFGKLIFRTVGYSGAEIRNLVNESAIMSVRKGHSLITQQDIVDVLDKQLLEGMGVLLTEEEQQKCEQSVSMETKRLLAVHEAGHILLAHLFPRFDWHAFSQLLPGGKETAISVFSPREDMMDQGYTTFGYMKMQMVVAHGGRCAEHIVFGDDITDGGKDDLERISRIAREMVISPANSRLGLSRLVKRAGMLDRPDNPDGELIKYKWEDPDVIPADMTVEVSDLFTRELTRYIEETEELAMHGLLQNRHILDMIAKELLEKSRITGLEVKEKMKHMFPVMLVDLVQPFQINLEEEGPLPVSKKLRYQPLDVFPAPLHRC